MKEVIYNGPSPLVKIGGYPDHLLGAVVAYPDDVADILVHQSRRQRFDFVVAGGKPPLHEPENSHPKPSPGKETDPSAQGPALPEPPAKRKPRKADE